MNWETLRKKIYYIDGSLRDIYVKNTNIEDWEKWIDLINTGYKVAFYNGQSGETESQIDKSTVFDYWNGKSDLLSGVTIHLEGILIKCHFFGGDEIENDITPLEINSIEDHNRLVSYLKDVSVCLGKEVMLTPENYLDYERKLIVVNGNDIEFDVPGYVIPEHLNQDKVKNNSQKKLSIIFLTILLFLLIWKIIPIIQVKMQLVSDFIPSSIFYEVAKPFIYISTVLLLVNIVAFALFFKRKYLTVIILGSIAFCLNVLYTLFNYFLSLV
ncbi:hypothetical protein [Pedobacter sp. UBA5917]|jgi:hypothetical protein|uniref:hypothetical protein n=1 Tax=Pedobacter sp. UBA5917 TaxID=1947061 RepID=UPI0025DDA156|nr:hypothetical protein [Pedobacter sp. UBA5917]